MKYSIQQQILFVAFRRNVAEGFFRELTICKGLGGFGQHSSHKQSRGLLKAGIFFYILRPRAILEHKLRIIQQALSNGDR